MAGQIFATTRNHATLIAFIMLIVCVISDYRRVFTVPLFTVFVLPMLVAPVNSKQTIRCWRMIGIPLALLNLSSFLGPLYYMLLRHDQGKFTSALGRRLDRVISSMEDSFSEICIPLINPMMGYNHTDYFKDTLEEFRCNFKSAFDYILSGMEVKAEFMRDPGISRVPIAIENKVSMSEQSVMAAYRRLAGLTRYSSLLLMTVLLWIYAGWFPLIAGMALYALFSIDEDNIDTIADSGVRHPDGIYRFRTYLFGYELSRGIGVSHLGVMHVPYHVCSANVVHMGKTRMEPVHVDRDKDLVTYGGPPTIGTYRKGMKVYANCEGESRISYEVSPQIDMDMTLYWPGMTRPGESGSPLYGVDGEEKLHLLGLCGRYIKPNPTSTIEFIPGSQANVEQIILHPGSGKTRTVLPEIIAKNLPKLGGKKILVSGPTRVVCVEIAKALNDLFVVGLNVSTLEGRNPTAAVQVAAHASALKMLITGSKEVRNTGMIIIDEAHVKDPMTIILRQYARGKNIRLVEMSATLDGKTENKSNHAITDIKINAREINTILDEELARDKRVLLFVPGARSQATEAAMKRYASFNPVILSRKTLREALNTISLVDGEGNYKSRLIISTDIAECGINIPDLDVVVDTMKKYTYVYANGIIYGETITPGVASVTQRRGRVGRLKPGSYYYTEEPATNEMETAAEFDAKVALTGRKWGDTMNNDWNIKLTEAQFEEWLKGEDSPLWIAMSTTKEGKKKKEPDIRKTLKEWRDGPVIYAGCGKDDCPCGGHYKAYDERNHTHMYEIPMEVSY